MRLLTKTFCYGNIGIVVCDFCSSPFIELSPVAVATGVTAVHQTETGWTA